MPFDPGQFLTERYRAEWRSHLEAFVSRYRWPLLIIVAPTLVVAIYLWVFAADQYASEASFIVRSPKTVGSSSSSSLIGQLLGGGAAPSEEAAGVADYLVSHDAARDLQKKLDIVSMYRRSGLDLFGRIKAKPTEEELTKYYGKHVKITTDKNSGIIKLEVRAFRPQDSKLIADTMLAMSETLINKFSERAEADAVLAAKRDVDRTQAQLLAVSGQMTQFRASRQSLDPASSSVMVMQVMGGMEAELAKARADFSAASSYLRPGSPKLEELRARVSALQGQVSSQRARLTTSAGPQAPTIAGFGQLSVQQEFAAKDYEGAMASYEAARADAVRQQFYLIHVVEPNLAQKALYPQRGIIVLTVLVSLLVAYGIGWLIIAGAREHAM